MTAFWDANWGNSSGNDEPTSSFFVFLSNAPVSFKVGLQGLKSQPTVEAELVTAALAMEDPMFPSKVMKKLVFGTRFDFIPLNIYNTLALHVAGNRT